MRGLLILLQIVVLGAGYAVFFNQWVEPVFFPYFNLFPLAFPVIFVLNLVMLFFWWLYKWKIAVVFTLLSLVLLIPLNKIFHLYGEAETKESNLKLLTYNVRYFFDDAEGIMNFCKKENPDIILFQEMGSGSEWIIENSTQDKDFYFKNHNSLGIASKYPILKSEAFRLKKSIPRTFSYSDVLFHEDTVRIINFYLESLHLNQEEIKETEVNSKLQEKGKSLTKKVIKASEIHQKQIATIREKIVNCPYPIIVAGDMNSVPSSYEYYAIGRGLKDAFLSAGKGLGTTFPGLKYPLRLDYVFTSEDIKIKNHRVEKVPYSDHYPVIVELEIPTKN